MNRAVQRYLMLALLSQSVWSLASRAESLSESWGIALAVDQRLQASQDRVQAARWRYAMARAGYFPSIRPRIHFIHSFWLAAVSVPVMITVFASAPASSAITSTRASPML